MNKYALPLLFLLLSPLVLLSQKNLQGNHFITNYPMETYKAAPQNWSVVQDGRGVIYVGNQGVVLEYDGESWNAIPNNNNSYIRSLAVDSSGTVYAGSNGEFGCLRPDRKGKLVYHELSNQVDSSFKEVWKTYVYQDTVYFCSSEYIFKYVSDSLISLVPMSDNNFLDFMVRGTLYAGDYKKGLLKIEGDTAVSATGGDFYQERDIFSILHFKDNLLAIAVSGEGLFLYNQKTGISKNISTLGKEFGKLNSYLKSVQLYCGIRRSNGDLVYGSLDDGVIIVNPEDGTIMNHYTDENGLNDPTIINLFESRYQDLWLGLNNGIAQIETGSPFKKFSRDDGIQGMPIDVRQFNGKFFLGTTNGLMQQVADQNGMATFAKIPDIQNQTWQLLDFHSPYNQDHYLIAGTHKGVYDITKDSYISRLAGKYYKTYSLLQSEFHPEKLYIGSYNGIALIELKENRTWHDHGELISDSADRKKFDAAILSMVETNDSTLWAATDVNGLYKVTNERNVVAYDTTDGLPSVTKNQVVMFLGEMYVLSKNGIYHYDRTRDAFFQDSIFNGRYNNRFVKFLYPLKNQSAFVVYKTGDKEILEKVNYSDGHYQARKIPFNRLNVGQYYNIYQDPGGLFWFSTSDGVISYNPGQRTSLKEYHTLIRETTLGFDSILFYGTNYTQGDTLRVHTDQPDDLKYTLDYKYNNVSFKFSAPFFRQESMNEYSYQLVGYDDKWSKWSLRTDKGYTNLDEGSYTFRVKARNIYGKESKPATFSFAIKPPFYRTIWAYLLYVILGIGLIILIVKWYTRRLEREKVRLEQIVQERTREVVEQKDKIEKQRDEIAKKNRDITDSIEYASKIQNAVLPSSNITKQILPEHFIFFKPRDIVSGDFYWVNQKNDLIIIIAADCTGHGVPGAFMSMLGVSLLNEIVNKHEVTKANLILNELREEVKRTLRQTGREGEAKDGMDISLCLLDRKKMQMQYAGAYNPLYLFRDGKLYQYKADRMPIGIYIKEKPTFSNQLIDLKKGDTFYIFSDGYPDQFGGENGRKFKTRQLKDLLADIQDKSMDEQYRIVEETINKWKGDHEQIDDVLLMGVRIG